MEYQSASGGRLQISSDVLAKIARLASMEITGVADVATENAGVRGLLKRIAPPSPIQIEMRNEAAEVTVSLFLEEGVKIPEVCSKVQENVKSSIQNMTQITVAKVNVIVAGIIFPPTEEDEYSL